MSNKRTLVGRVVIWGLLGVGAYTMLQIGRPYFFSAAPELSKSVENKIKEVKRSIVEKTENSVETLKETYTSKNKNDKGVVNSEQTQKGAAEPVDSARGEKSNEDTSERDVASKHTSPLKRLGNIADDYIEDTQNVPEASHAPDTPQPTVNGDADEKRRQSAQDQSDSDDSARSVSKSNGRTSDFTAKEKKVFERQLSVVDELLN